MSKSLKRVECALAEAGLSATIRETSASASGASVVRCKLAIRGVAPIGHLRAIPTWMDPRLDDFALAWAAAGTPRHVFAIAPADLARLTGARRANFTAQTDM